MYLTQRIFISSKHPHFKKLDEYAFLCKNLFNVATYIQRQRIFAGKGKLSSIDLINTISRREDKDFKSIPAKVAQQTIKQVAQNFTAYFAAVKSYQKNPKKFTGEPKLPRYLTKDGRANIIFTKQAISKNFNKGILSLSSYFDEKLDFKLGKLSKKINLENLQEVKVVRCAGGYSLNITYKVSEPTLKQTLRSCGVDIGVNNLITVASPHTKPFIISGKPVKAINQQYNKEKAKWQSCLDKATNPDVILYCERNLERISCKRFNKINNYFHNTSRKLIDYAVFNNLDQIVIGYNTGWKQGTNLGKRNNQNFVYIPFLRLINQIKSKAALEGITVITYNESYTSKCSFLDNESVEKHDQYMGKRIKRGLFRSSKGKLINADVNAAFNILRKVTGNFNYDPRMACRTPQKLTV